MRKIGLFLCCFLFFQTVSSAQALRPRIGLTLSGGAAKGLAHIGLLRMIDSLGIKVDYISGTSMGAVVGGLYSIGYSADSLKQMAMRLNWDLLLSNKVEMQDINIEEKDEFGRYLFELPMKNGRPSLPTGFIEGQALSVLLTNLCFPVHHIRNFDQLPIPFHCVATDARSGEKVILKEGFLPSCLRASMAIPTLFTPVRMNGRLLVDGGLALNFPVEEVRSMGADYVIGGYTGFRLLKEEELNSAFKLFYQAQSYSSTADAQKQIKLCDLFIDNADYLGDLGAGDFNSAKEIIEAGERAARAQLPELIRIAEEQHKAEPSSLRHQQIQAFPPEIRINCIRIEGASLRNMALVYGKLDLAEGQSHSLDELNAAVSRVFGTRNFEKVYYALEIDSIQNTTLVVTVQESRPGALKLGIHYDSEQSSGVLLNLTYRNLIPGSRFFSTLYLSERPKFNLQFYKFIGQNQRWWLSASNYFENIPQNLYYRGNIEQNFSSVFNRFSLGINRTLNRTSTIRFTTCLQRNLFQPDIDPRNLSEPPATALIGLDLSNLSFSLRFHQNTLDAPYFPKKGAQLTTEIRFSTLQRYKLVVFVNDTLMYPSRRVDLELKDMPLLKFQIAYEKLNKLKDWISIQSKLGLGLTYNLNVNPTDPASYIALGANWLENYSFGGIFNSNRETLIPFMGLRSNEVLCSQYFMGALAAQIQIKRSYFVSPTLNFAVVGGDFQSFLNNLTKWNFSQTNTEAPVAHYFGYGLQLGMRSMIGPIHFTVSSNNDLSVLRYYLSIGYRL